MRFIVFLGGGGFFVETYEYVKGDIASGALKGMRIKGLLDDLGSRPVPEVECLGKIDDYRPKDDDVFILCVGSPTGRRSIHGRVKARGGTFLSFVHSAAYVSPSAEIREGAVVCPGAIINARATVGTCAAINVLCSVGHDARVGDFSVLSPYSALNGEARIGEGSFLGTRATIFPGVALGRECVVDSHAYAKADLGDHFMVSVRGKYRAVRNRLKDVN